MSNYSNTIIEKTSQPRHVRGFILMMVLFIVLASCTLALSMCDLARLETVSVKYFQHALL